MKRTFLTVFSVFCLLLIGTYVSSQTTINGSRTALGVIDYSGASHTRPTIVVASTGSLPSTGCNLGELAIVTGATLGQQIYQNSGTGTCVWTQQLNTGSSSGGGFGGYGSAVGVSFSGTQFFPIVGGGAPSGTETNVDVDSPASATITNLYVQLQTDPGNTNTIALTFSKNTTLQSVTCTVTGNGSTGTNCNDTTHSFSVSQGDKLTLKSVTTGTVLSALNLTFTYQFGNITATGTVNSGTSGQVGIYNTTGTAITGETMSQDCTITNTGVITCTKTNNVSFAPSATTDTTNAANINSGVLLGAHGGGLVLLEQHTASSSATLNFTTCMSSSYGSYLIRLENVLPATNSTNLLFRISTNGGSSYDSSSNYAYSIVNASQNNTNSTSKSGGDTSFLVATSAGNTGGGGGVSGDINLFNGSPGTDRISWTGSIFTPQASDSLYQSGFGNWNSTTAVTAFQFFFASSVNITTGTIRCYGVSKL